MGLGLLSGLLIGGWLALTQGGSDEVLAHSHSSREGLQSHVAHSLL